MDDLSIDIIFSYFKDLPLKEKEIAFWKMFIELKHEQFLGSLNRKEVNQIFNTNLNAKEYKYIKERLTTYSFDLGQSVKIIFENILPSKNL